MDDGVQATEGISALVSWVTNYHIVWRNVTIWLLVEMSLLVVEEYIRPSIVHHSAWSSGLVQKCVDGLILRVVSGGCLCFLWGIDLDHWTQVLSLLQYICRCVVTVVCFMFIHNFTSVQGYTKLWPLGLTGMEVCCISCGFYQQFVLWGLARQPKVTLNVT